VGGRRGCSVRGAGAVNDEGSVSRHPVVSRSFRRL
jgi:hypothetical protein